MNRLNEYDVDSVEQRADLEDRPIARATKALRVIGGILLLSSAVAFCIQGWSQWGSLGKHFVYLFFTVTVCVLGLWLRHGWKEPKSAKILLGVSGLMIPAAFAQVGAMIYAKYFGYQSGFPDLLRYQSIPIESGILAVGLSIIFAVFVGYAIFSEFIERQASVLTASYVFTNLLILIPFRGELYVVASSLLVAAGLLVLNSNLRLPSSFERNQGELAFAIALPFAPLFVPLFRTFLLYSNTLLAFAVVSFTIGAILYFVATTGEENGWKGFLGFVAITCFLIAWSTGVSGVLEEYGIYAYQYAKYNGLMYGIPSALIVFACSFGLGGAAGMYRMLAAVYGVFESMSLMFTLDTILGSFVCCLFGCLVIISACVNKEKYSLVLGSMCFGAGILYQCVHAFKYISISPWLSLAVAGITAVGIAVALEKKGDSLGVGWRRLKGLTRDWR